jgi:hypothetical protein
LNRVYYKPELVSTLERLENFDYLNDTLLDELQSKIYLLMKQKYYTEFKSYSEFHKILLKNDFIFKISSLSSSSQTPSADFKTLETPSNKMITNPIILAELQSTMAPVDLNSSFTEDDLNLNGATGNSSLNNSISETGKVESKFAFRY